MITKKWTVLMVFGMLSLLFLSAAIMTPWYVVHTHGSIVGIDFEADAQYTLFEKKIKTESNGTSSENTTTYSDDYFKEVNPTTVDVINTTFFLAVASFVMMLFFVISNTVRGKDTVLMSLIGSSKFERTVSILAMICIIVAPIFMMVTLPGAMEVDAKKTAMATGALYTDPFASLSDSPYEHFFGSVNVIAGIATMSMSWGGSSGWFLAITAFVFVLITVITNFVIKDETVHISKYVQPPPPIQDVPPPSIAEPPPTVPLPQQAAVQESHCLICGGQLRHIVDTERNYCDKCGMYYNTQTEKEV